MDPFLKFLNIAVPVVYMGTFVLYSRLFMAEDEQAYRVSTRLSMGFALALHTVYLLAIAAQFDRCPLATRAEGLLFGAWLLSIIHVINERLARQESLGIFTLLPAVVGTSGAAYFQDFPAARAVTEQSPQFVFHIVTSLASYVSFCVAAVLALMYVVQHRRLKRKQFDVAFRKIPSLELLDNVAAAWTLAGCVALVLGALTGWVQRAGHTGSVSSLVPLFLVLAVFVASVIMRTVAGWRGIRHIVTILIGFAVLLAASLLSFLKSHGFYG